MPKPKSASAFSRFEWSFFKAIPTCAGVYFMKGGRGQILYIGKAKNLQNRLRSYRTPSATKKSRKIRRLGKLVRTIEWELCKNEEAALLRENDLLQEHRPPFNILNTYPENYYFLEFVPFESRFHLRLITDLDEKSEVEGTLTVGAFKSRRRVRRACIAISRLFHAVADEDAHRRTDLPGYLIREREEVITEVPLARISKIREEDLWFKWMSRYLRGISTEFCKNVRQIIQEREIQNSFFLWMIEQEIEALEEFFEFGCKRNRSIRRHCRVESLTIPQEDLDNYLVKLKFRKKSP